MSRFDDQFLDELKARLRPSDVIGKTVKLRRQGREYAGLSPFAKEKSPSFFVNDEKGFYHCFSTGKHGDLIAWLQETERLTFPEAIERLAAEAGMALPAQDPRAAAVDSRRLGLIDWLKLAAAWYEAQLHRPVGANARAYLVGRAFPEGEWGRFRIGFAPESRTGLKDYLVAKGAKLGDLIDAGLLIAPEDGGAPYDRFRNRIMFPIADGRGRIISFGGRALDPNARAKYLNGPDTTLFHKGRVLYGLHEARALLHAAGEGAPLAVVEGYMDVIACQRAGVPACAPMGTALTEDQMELLWRLHPQPTLCFDNDGAGRRAASNTVDRALPMLRPSRTFRFTAAEGGKDPDDILRDHGPAALVAQLAKTRPLIDVLFDREKNAHDLETPEAKAGLRRRLRDAAATIQDADVGRAYQQDLRDRCDALFTRPREPMQVRLKMATPIAKPSPALLEAVEALAVAARPTIEAILAKAEVTPSESALFELLTQQEDVERRVAAVLADLSAPGAVVELASLKAERTRLEAEVRAATHGAGRAA